MQLKLAVIIWIMGQYYSSLPIKHTFNGINVYIIGINVYIMRINVNIKEIHVDLM